MASSYCKLTCAAAFVLRANLTSQPRESEYLIFEFGGPHTNTLNGFWDEKPEVLRTWSRWPIKLGVVVSSVGHGVVLESRCGLQRTSG